MRPRQPQSLEAQVAPELVQILRAALPEAKVWEYLRGMHDDFKVKDARALARLSEDQLVSTALSQIVRPARWIDRSPLASLVRHPGRAWDQSLQGGLSDGGSQQRRRGGLSDDSLLESLRRASCAEHAQHEAARKEARPTAALQPQPPPTSHAGRGAEAGGTCPPQNGGPRPDRTCAGLAALSVVLSRPMADPRARRGGRRSARRSASCVAAALRDARRPHGSGARCGRTSATLQKRYRSTRSPRSACRRPRHAPRPCSVGTGSQGGGGRGA